MDAAPNSWKVNVTTLGNAFDVVLPHSATVAELKACLQSHKGASSDDEYMTLLKGSEILDDNAVAPQEVTLVRSFAHKRTAALRELLGKRSLPCLSSLGLDYSRTWAVPAGCEIAPPPDNEWQSCPAVPNECDRMTLLVDVLVAGPLTTFSYFTLLWDKAKDNWRLRDHGVTMLTEAP